MRDDKLEYIETRYGFKWGVAEVIRIASHRGHVIVEVNTPRERVMLRVTPTGLIRQERLNPRVFNIDGGRL